MAAVTAASGVRASKPYRAASAGTAWPPIRDWNAPVAGWVTSCGSGTPGTGR